MFKELFELWKKENLLNQALNDSYVMLQEAQEMFTESVKSLRESDTGEIGIDIYEKDQIVNRYERKVRRKVLKHLAITGSTNMIVGLVLVSIVIDIERIGDYTKNITELAVAHPKRLRCGARETDVLKVEKAVASMFQAILPSLKESDKVRAHKLMFENWWITKLCDEIVIDMIQEKDKTLGSSDAVATALYTRYLKRIGSHLMNIASGIVNPFERIGFREQED